MIQHIAKSKKTKTSKRPRDEEYTKKELKGRNQPKKLIEWKNK